MLVSLCAGLFVGGLSIFFQISGVYAGTLFNRTAHSSAVSFPNDGSGGSFKAVGEPVRLTIPSIGVDAHVQSVGLSLKGTGDIGIPTNFTDVAWFNQSKIPGFPGVAIIDGHVDGKNVPKAVFYDLDKLQAGDVVQVTDSDGAILEFKVVRSQMYNQDASTEELLADRGVSELILITCGGDWNASERLYDERVVVFTELITP